MTIKRGVKAAMQKEGFHQVNGALVLLLRLCIHCQKGLKETGGPQIMGQKRREGRELLQEGKVTADDPSLLAVEVLR